MSEIEQWSESKERMSGDKVRSALSLILGERATQFDAMMQKAPNAGELMVMAKQKGIERLEAVIFDLDGTLLPPYAEVNDAVKSLLEGYLARGIRVFIYSNSPKSDRLSAFKTIEKDGHRVIVIETDEPKPSLNGYKGVCSEHKIDPKKRP
ncbi:HAD family hydrolase [Candidatus Peregrinibacteria bacterium]|nr:MAG: HAD family hydrolase [Candidatus Peregrinibacteria bacterium]